MKVNTMDKKPARYFVNQPSMLQPMHKYHGLNVLAIKEPSSDDAMRVYFLSGDCVSMIMPKLALSKGWRTTTAT
jgi:hypothetical protein